jgi:hypothetical protein
VHLFFTSETRGISETPHVASELPPFQLPTIEERLLEFPLIRPRLPASDWDVEVLHQEHYLGRPAELTRARRREASIRARDPRLSGFWPRVDQYECVIDLELQMVLRVTSLVGGVSVATVAVEHLSVDLPLATSRFDFSPPTGTRIVPVGEKATLPDHHRL